ncbi:GGDEF domain-containing protein [Sinorhizobium sp. BG8]|uniref:GGDEF domain-containing protein n=1 Tax=Sinorhizobium sp. BG8 TaxID=2613773 RepID=UPI001FEFC2A4|nr:GGDEF domain-containing protein [Sinorhizobium sp. BG8]
MLLVSDFKRLFAIGAFAAMLGGLCLLALGVGAFYRSRVNPWLLAGIFGAGVVTDMLIFDLPRGTPGHSIPYQLPFLLVQALACNIVYQSRRRGLSDRTLLTLLLLTVGYYALKAFAAGAVGAGVGAADYLFSQFALVSQGLGAVLIVSVGLGLVAVLVRELIDDAVASSDIDPLSGLLNRRGFARLVAPQLQRSGTFPGVLVLADIDYFKRINDKFGHHAGDEVIHTFAQVLRSHAPSEASVARIGGEEFAVYLPVADCECARMFAMSVRATMAEREFGAGRAKFRITASFGIAVAKRGGTLEGTMREADTALYAAKAAGRDQVMIADVAPTVVRGDWNRAAAG